MKAAFLIGRIVFGGFFLYNGINHFKQKHALAQYADSKNVPYPDAAITASGVALAAGGASIMLSVKPQVGALAILGFLAIVSPTIHDFWSAEDPQQAQNEMIHFSKNMALLGAALALYAVKDWPLSVAP
jgi:putative oxidoreductase